MFIETEADKVKWDNEAYIEVTWRGDLSNWDRCDLTALWVECCRRRIRFSLRGCGPRYMKADKLARLYIWLDAAGENEAAEYLIGCGEWGEVCRDYPDLTAEEIASAVCGGGVRL